MSFKTKLRKGLIDLTGYWIYKHNEIPVGCDLITDLQKKIGSPIKVIFDVGANIGQTAITFNESFPEAKVFSFEPVSNTYDKLKINLKDLKQVNCYKLALGSETEFVDIKLFDDNVSYLNSLNPNAMNNSGNFKVERIEVTTGDKFCVQNGVSEIDLLKIDTEGYEIQVLTGFKDLIDNSKIKAIYCEVGLNSINKRSTFFNDLMVFANQKGFSFYGLYEINNNEIMEGNNYGNALFINNKAVKAS